MKIALLPEEDESGELEAADAVFEKALRLWHAGSDPGAVLNPGRLLGLEADGSSASGPPSRGSVRWSSDQPRKTVDAECRVGLRADQGGRT
jgi:hypothetical protein